jgi:hypothetical protein
MAEVGTGKTYQKECCDTEELTSKLPPLSQPLQQFYRHMLLQSRPRSFMTRVMVAPICAGGAPQALLSIPSTSQAQECSTGPLLAPATPQRSLEYAELLPTGKQPAAMPLAGAHKLPDWESLEPQSLQHGAATPACQL